MKIVYSLIETEQTDEHVGKSCLDVLQNGIHVNGAPIRLLLVDEWPPRPERTGDYHFTISPQYIKENSSKFFLPPQPNMKDLARFTGLKIHESNLYQQFGRLQMGLLESIPADAIDGVVVQITNRPRPVKNLMETAVANIEKNNFDLGFAKQGPTPLFSYYKAQF